MYPEGDYPILKFTLKNNLSQDELNWDFGLGLDNNLRNTHQKNVDFKDLPQLDIVNPQVHLPDDTPTAPVLQPSKQNTRATCKLKPPDKTACVICDSKAKTRNPSKDLVQTITVNCF